MGPSSENDWIVTQIGARQHYAVARAMHEKGRLRQLYTDAWCSRGHALLRAMPEPFQSFANRYHPAIPQEAVTAFNAQAVLDRIRWSRLPTDSDAARYQFHADVGRRFASNVRDDLKGRGADPDDLIFFGYDTGCYEVLEWFDGRDGLTIVDQIDPGRVEKEIVLEEIERWPGWATQAPVLHPPHYERIEAEWELASVVMVNSEWSKQALVQQGVAASKIEIVPIAYDPPDGADEERPVSSEDGPFRLLWLGSVILRKGIPYLIEAAKRLQTSSIHIDVVGPIGITDRAMREAPPNVEFHGRVSRDSVGDWYGRADAFVLPTLSDGFAITQLEAMAHGLPVIATPHCGQVVDDGETGLIVPVRDADALAQAIDRLAADRSTTRAMGRAARNRLDTYHPSHVSNQILAMAHKRLTPAETKR